jgi:hypothetical protein
MRAQMWGLGLGLVLGGCDLADKIPINLPPILLEADPAEGEELTLEEGGVAVYVVVTDEDTETLTAVWSVVYDDDSAEELEGEPFSPSIERTGEDYVLFAQSFTVLSLEAGASLEVVITDAEGLTLTLDWPLVAGD